MINIGSHGLICPEPDDYPAVALYMQCLGETIDSTLQEQLESLESFFNRPTIIVTNSVNKTITAPGGLLDVFDTVVFNNTTFMSLEIGATVALGGTGNVIWIGSPAGAPVTIPYLRGVYSVGAGQRMQPVGSHDPGERQVCSIEAIDLSSTDYLFSFETNFDRADDVTRNTGTGLADAQNARFSMQLQGVSGVQLIHAATTFSSASDVNVLAGAFLWVTYDGPTDVVEVA